MWKHFITQTDEKRWTQGKRKAESDNLVGISFLTTIQAPSILSETENSIDNNIGQFTRNMEKMDVAVKNLSTIAVDQTIRTRNAVKKDYQVQLKSSIIQFFIFCRHSKSTFEMIISTSKRIFCVL